MPANANHGVYKISTDRQRVDVDAVHAFLTQSYWSPGIPREVVERAIANSLCFSVYLGAQQVGFARVVTDKVTFAYSRSAEPCCSGKNSGEWLGSYH